MPGPNETSTSRKDDLDASSNAESAPNIETSDIVKWRRSSSCKESVAPERESQFTKCTERVSEAQRDDEEIARTCSRIGVLLC